MSSYCRRIALTREQATGRPAFSFRPRSDDLISAGLDAAFLITQQAVSAWLLKQCVLFAIGLRHAADKVHTEIEGLCCHKRSRQISEHCVRASKGVAARVRVEQMRWAGVCKQSGTSGGRDRLAVYIRRAILALATCVRALQTIVPMVRGSSITPSHSSSALRARTDMPRAHTPPTLCLVPLRLVKEGLASADKRCRAAARSKCHPPSQTPICERRESTVRFARANSA